MTKHDIEKVIESKREYRKELAARPIAEKLRLLDELHRRARTLETARMSRLSTDPKSRR